MLPLFSWYYIPRCIFFIIFATLAYSLYEEEEYAKALAVILVYLYITILDEILTGDPRGFI